MRRGKAELKLTVCEKGAEASSGMDRAGAILIAIKVLARLQINTGSGLACGTTGACGKTDQHRLHPHHRRHDDR